MKISVQDQFEYRNMIIDNVLCKYNFPPRQIRVLMHIIRNTLGYNKTHLHTSYRDIAKATALQLTHAHKTVKQLEEMNIIATRPTKNKTHFQLNINYMKWHLPDPETIFTGNELLPSKGVTASVTPGGNGETGEERAGWLRFLERMGLAK